MKVQTVYEAASVSQVVVYTLIGSINNESASSSGDNRMRHNRGSTAWLKVGMPEDRSDENADEVDK